MTTNPLILDMLGEGLKNAVVSAQDRLSDDTVMARIFQGLVNVERGEPAVILEEGLGYDAAIAYLDALA